MQKTITMVLGLALICRVLLTCTEGQEQQTKAPPDVIDLTGRLDVTPEEVARGLGLIRTRTFLPVPQVALPAPGKIAITIPFDFNSARIRPDAEPNLRSVGQALQHSSDRIRIEGHTDGIGKAQANLRFSKRRAQSVKQYLVNNFSIAAERLLVVGLGAQEPITNNTTEAGRQKNRRVVLVNLDLLQQQ